MKICCDVHTHTTFGDGTNTPEEMLLSAIEKGCKTYGFSEHAYTKQKGADVWCMSPEGQLEYARQVTELKNKYDGQIKVLLGAEVDVFAEPLTFKPEYKIGSVHAYMLKDQLIDIDNTPAILISQINEYYGGDALKLVRDFYETVTKIVDITDCDIIGHFDLITKFNEKHIMFDTQSKLYRDCALQALDALIEKHRIFEINTGAISRGWRSDPYPQEFLLRRLAERGAAVMLSSDCHAKQNIMFYFDEAEQYARECGIKEFVTF